MKNNIIIIAIVVIFVAIIIVARNIIKTNRTINKIDKMITLAAEGDFKEEFFDESKLSALETKFANYLSVSNISAINVALARSIISSEGGYIKVSSNPGQGSTFSVFLPRNS